MSARTCSAALLLASLGAVAVRADEPKRPLMAVLEFSTKLTAEAKADADPGYFSDVVRSQSLDLLPDMRLMTRENMVVLLQASGKDLSACEGECDVDTGRKLGADYVISGELLKVGTSFKLDLKLHATGDGRLLSGAQASGKSVDDLDAAVPAAISKLVSPLRAPAPAAPPPAPTPAAIRPAPTTAAPAQPALIPAPAAVPTVKPVVPAASPGAPARVAGAPAAFQHIEIEGDLIKHKETFFDKGERTVRSQASAMLHEVATVLSGPPPRHGLVVCRGESDKPQALRMARQRAFALRHALIEWGVRPAQVRAEGVTQEVQQKETGHAKSAPCTIVLR